MSFIDPQSLARISMTVNAGAKTLDIGVKQPFKMWLPDVANPGSNILKMITAPAQICGDGHASENFTMGSMGQTLAVAWAQNFPIFWYLCFLSGTTYWVASRNPCMKVMPATAQIGYMGHAPSGTHAQGDAWVATTSDVTADIDGLPVWGPIGSMPVQRAANETDVTLVALTAGQDGFGKFQEGVKFTFPLGQNGNVANTICYSDASADVPTWTTAASIVSVYTIDRTGAVRWLATTQGAGSCIPDGGAGAVTLKWALPLAMSTLTSNPDMLGIGYLVFGAGSASRDLKFLGGNSTYMTITEFNTLGAVQEDDFANANNYVQWNLVYQAF